MFEQSLLGTSRRDRRRGRWIALGSIAVQVALLIAFVAGPLLYPSEMPPYKPAETKTVSLVQPKPQPVVVRKPVVVREATSAAAPATEVRQTVQPIAGPSLCPALGNDETPKLIAAGDGGGMGGHSVPGLESGPSAGNGGPIVVARPTAPAAPLNISRGVSAGLLLTPLRPVYPQIARTAHISGTVVVTATIDKSGRIVGLQVLSGPPMLQKAAADAVRDARYRPYLLNGQPIEVVTTFSVNFIMGAG
jgi:protein TonB